MTGDLPYLDNQTLYGLYPCNNNDMCS